MSHREPAYSRLIRMPEPSVHRTDVRTEPRSRWEAPDYGQYERPTKMTSYATQLSHAGGGISIRDRAVAKTTTDDDNKDHVPQVAWILSLVNCLVTAIVFCIYLPLTIYQYTNNGGNDGITYQMFGRATYTIAGVVVWDREWRTDYLLVAYLAYMVVVTALNFFIGNNGGCGCAEQWRWAKPAYFSWTGSLMRLGCVSAFSFAVANTVGITEIWELIAIALIDLGGVNQLESALYRRHESNKHQVRLAAAARHIYYKTLVANASVGRSAETEEINVHQMLDNAAIALQGQNEAGAINWIKQADMARAANIANAMVTEQYPEATRLKEAALMEKGILPDYVEVSNKNFLIAYEFLMGTLMRVFVVTCILVAYGHNYVNLTLVQHVFPFVYFGYEGIYWIVQLVFVIKGMYGWEVRERLQHLCEMVLYMLELLTVVTLWWFVQGNEHSFITVY